MEKLFDKIYKKHINGLYLINTPTGSAKSYTAVQTMKKYSLEKVDGHHCIFITNNLNNLPIDDLKKAFGKDYDKYVIRVESIVDNILHNLDDSIIPAEFKELSSYKNL